MKIETEVMCKILKGKEFFYCFSCDSKISKAYIVISIDIINKRGPSKNLRLHLHPQCAQKIFVYTNFKRISHRKLNKRRERERIK